MRIAQVAPLTEAVPPKLYGGTERVVHWLTEELVALGHDVTLYASGDSRTSAKLDATWPKALRLDGAVRDPNALHMVMLERVRRKCDDEDFDFLHFHLDYYPFSLFYRQPTPFLTTLHGRLDLPEHQPVFTTFSKVPVISISNAQRRPVPQANWVRTIHHGLPENLLTPQATKPSYLAVLGRIAPEKGVDRAIKIATRHRKLSAAISDMRKTNASHTPPAREGPADRLSTRFLTPYCVPTEQATAATTAIRITECAAARLRR